MEQRKRRSIEESTCIFCVSFMNVLPRDFHFVLNFSIFFSYFAILYTDITKNIIILNGCFRKRKVIVNFCRGYSCCDYKPSVLL